MPAGNIWRTLDFLLGRPPAWVIDDTDICLLDRNATRHRPCCFPLLICAQSQFGSGLCPGSRTHSSPGLHGRRLRGGRHSRFACRLKTSPIFRDRHRNPADAIGSGAILGNAWIGNCGHWPSVRGVRLDKSVANGYVCQVPDWLATCAACHAQYSPAIDFQGPE